MDRRRNATVFGKCANPNYHGHNYELIVSVKGKIHPETGFVMDMKVLKEFDSDRRSKNDLIIRI